MEDQAKNSPGALQWLKDRSEQGNTLEAPELDLFQWVEHNEAGACRAGSPEAWHTVPRCARDLEATSYHSQMGRRALQSAVLSVGLDPGINAT